jgi:hypothetical protein
LLLRVQFFAWVLSLPKILLLVSLPEAILAANSGSVLGLTTDAMISPAQICREVIRSTDM